MGDVIKLNAGTQDEPIEANAVHRGYQGVCHGGPIDQATLASHGPKATFRGGLYRWDEVKRCWWWYGSEAGI